MGGPNGTTPAGDDAKVQPRLDVIDQSIKWLAARCGKTPTEEFILAWRAYHMGLRRKTEPIAEYVNRFENLTRQLQSHGVKLDKRENSF